MNQIQVTPTINMACYNIRRRLAIWLEIERRITWLDEGLARYQLEMGRRQMQKFGEQNIPLNS